MTASEPLFPLLPQKIFFPPFFKKTAYYHFFLLNSLPENPPFI